MSETLSPTSDHTPICPLTLSGPGAPSLCIGLRCAAFVPAARATKPGTPVDPDAPSPPWPHLEGREGGWCGYTAPAAVMVNMRNPYPIDPVRTVGEQQSELIATIKPKLRVVDPFPMPGPPTDADLTAWADVEKFGNAPTPTPAELALVAKDRIGAFKRYRERTGAGLKDAKEAFVRPFELPREPKSNAADVSMRLLAIRRIDNKIPDNIPIGAQAQAWGPLGLAEYGVTLAGHDADYASWNVPANLIDTAIRKLGKASAGRVTAVFVDGARYTPPA